MRKWIVALVIAMVVIFAVLRPHDETTWRFVEFKTNNAGDVLAVVEGRVPLNAYVFGVQTIEQKYSNGWEYIPKDSFTLELLPPRRLALGPLPETSEPGRIAWSVQKRASIGRWVDWAMGNNVRRYSGAMRSITNEFPARPITGLLAAGVGHETAEITQTETNLPHSVRARIKAQVAAYFPSQDLKGIPWLDPSKDWNSITNWPEEIQYDGKQLKLEVRIDYGDTGSITTARTNLGGNYSANYRQEVAGEPWKQVIKPFCFWHDGVKTESGVSAHMREVFAFQFYPSGELYLFNYEDKASARNYDEYYNKDGKRVLPHKDLFATGK